MPYTDEATAGNALHPDKPKECQCIYWSFRELPAWFRRRWFTFRILRTSDQEQIKGGLSGVVRRVLKEFVGDAKFNVGVNVADGNGGTFKMVVTKIKFIQDEKAFKNTWSVKGASGWRCCLRCKNVLSCNTQKIAGDAYLKHVPKALPHEFDIQSDEEFFKHAAVCRLLTADGKLDVQLKGHSRIWRSAQGSLMIRTACSLTWSFVGSLA